MHAQSSQAAEVPAISSRGQAPAIVTIPSSDRTFRTHVDAVLEHVRARTPEALEIRLRRVFPRVRVRSRELSDEGPVWYVYRDGAWRPEQQDGWWREARAARLELSADGLLVAANPMARGLLGIPPGAEGGWHFSDLVAPGTLHDARSLFATIVAGGTLDATLRVRPATGDVIALDVRAWSEGGRVLAVLRLADDVELGASATAALPSLECRPESDALFAGYAQRELVRMPEPSPDGLELRLRRLYPHATVEERGDRWIATREPGGTAGAESWWLDAGRPTVRYDAEGLILHANDAATNLLGAGLVGRHWQDIVTPGSTGSVGPVIEMIRAVGHALSRFRMPTEDGSLVEFDSYTEVEGDTLTTVMRPIGHDGAMT